MTKDKDVMKDILLDGLDQALSSRRRMNSRFRSWEVR